MNIIKNSNVTNGEDYIQIEKNVAYIVTTTENQKNNKENNYSTIDFGECEDTLKEKYNISQNDSLILFKIDALIDNILKVEYELYYPFTENNLTKLDLSFCKDKKIDILIPINIPFNEIDKYNISSGLYNDICYTLTTESGTDEILKDRQNEYKNNNISVCEEDCVFTEYNEYMRAKCSCYTKLELPLVSTIKVDKQKLFSNFKDIRNIGNFIMLKCIDLFFDKNNIFKNSSNYIFIILLLLSLSSILVFTFYDIKIINKLFYQYLKGDKLINIVCEKNNSCDKKVDEQNKMDNNNNEINLYKEQNNEIKVKKMIKDDKVIIEDIKQLNPNKKKKVKKVKQVGK